MFLLELGGLFARHGIAGREPHIKVLGVFELGKALQVRLFMSTSLVLLSSPVRGYNLLVSDVDGAKSRRYLYPTCMGVVVPAGPNQKLAAPVRAKSCAPQCTKPGAQKSPSNKLVKGHECLRPRLVGVVLSHGAAQIFKVAPLAQRRPLAHHDWLVCRKVLCTEANQVHFRTGHAQHL